MVVRVALNFPNQSRSYDRTRHCVRFWAYDEALEIPFFVEEEALCSIDPRATRSEAGFLIAFDLHGGRPNLFAPQPRLVHAGGSGYAIAPSATARAKEDALVRGRK